MKKDSLLKMKDLPATEEMLAVAREDVPVKVGSGWNTSYRCRYSGFARSSVEGGILKVTLYDPDAMRLGGTLPVYEIFMEKEKQQFLTYYLVENGTDLHRSMTSEEFHDHIQKQYDNVMDGVY